MKKIYLILASTLIGSAMFAQANTALKAHNNFQTPVKSAAVKKSANGVSRTTIVNHMVNFNDAHVDYYSSTPSGFFRTLFPDSTTPAEYNGGVINYTYLHGIAQTFDLSSEVVNAQIGGADDGFDPTMTATLDSINVFGFYSQGSYGYTDTLLVTVVDYIGDFLLTDAFYAPWGVDTIRGFAIERDTNTDEVLNANASYKIAIDPADTLANGTMYMKFPAGATVDSRYSIVLQFIPGGSYTTADTINKQLGMFRVYTTEANGDGTLMSYIKNDRNGAAFFTKFAKYDTPPARRYYATVYQFGAGQSDNFDIESVLSQTNSLSIDEETNEASLFQNYPNPTNGMTTVSYSLQNDANVSFEMIDVTGKTVAASFEGNQNAGNYSIEINTAELNSGIYFYSVVVNGNKITKKMVVTK